MAFGVAAVSMSAILIRYSEATAAAIAFYRLLFSLALLYPLALKGAGPGLGIGLGDLKKGILSGFFLALHFGLWIESLGHTTVAASTLLVSLHPFFVFYLARIRFGESQRPETVAPVLLIFAGSAVIAGFDFLVGALYGDALALGGAVMMALYLVYGQELRQRLDLYSYCSLVYGSAAFFIGVWMILSGTPFGPYPAREWVLFLLMALIPTLLGHSVFNWALRWAPASTISVSILGEPVGAAFLAWVLLGENPSWNQIAGGLAVLLGIYSYVKSKERETGNKVRERAG